MVDTPPLEGGALKSVEVRVLLSAPTFAALFYQESARKLPPIEVGDEWRKSKQNFDFKELCRGLLNSPLRIKIS